MRATSPVSVRARPQWVGAVPHMPPPPPPRPPGGAGVAWPDRRLVPPSVDSGRARSGASAVGARAAAPVGFGATAGARD